MAGAETSMSSNTNSVYIEDAELHTCSELLTALSQQLHAQLDVNTNYILLQRQLERSHNHSIELLEGIAKKTEEMDKQWQNCVEETKNIRKQIVGDVERQIPYSAGIKSVKNAEQTKTDLKEKSAFMQRGVEEVKKVGEATVGIHVQTRLDQRRLAELEAKATDIANLDNKITKKIQEELQMADDIKKANRRAGNYGVCELTTGYRQLMRHLATALETLDQLKAKSNKNSTPISTLTVDELDQLLATLRKISGMIKIEISGAEHC